MKRKSGLFQLFAYTFLGLFAIMNIIPLFWMVVNSFKEEQEYAASPFSLPHTLQFSNYAKAWEVANMDVYFLNSIIITFASLIITVLLGALAAYFLSRFQFKLRGVTYSLFLLGMLVPIHATLIPIFLIMQKLQLLDTYWSLILPYTAFHLSLTVFILEGFMRGFPKDLEESGVMDGAGVYRIFWSIILPITRPALATVIILNFIYNWNEYLFALVLITSTELKTLPLGLANFAGIETASLTLQMAALTIALIPILIFYLLLQKQLVNGMTAGAVKG
ncbi:MULTISPECIES: carbohydrate ABC transporter permease [Paenibacillus]|uniref:Binding-protein-dependent transport systems inner membrane component n=2 Tax=Paenibacillus lactis TaxID=228574 RepID=G4H8J2_9BACL|nr:carbohydrate ABC transporter permease [Paenibacillus lactis]EHB68177.1 binding-protein-dependent transport systems inner membrane component [Paenibacillus lactis 154]MBP1892076.1 raffinose/stachyose/melibiose transport system permease protein [Paenibacillus lactis]MCM3492762.1 carbohydrate ABC transporter permease [Paenibacillus lactis]GIO89525.1 ABC transporter permease [Paenibacillus lactis]HAF99030.1 carbohydrate ABC transporter permease [Paenibacillus lactis]